MSKSVLYTLNVYTEYVVSKSVLKGEKGTKCTYYALYVVSKIVSHIYTSLHISTLHLPAHRGAAGGAAAGGRVVGQGPAGWELPVLGAAPRGPRVRFVELCLCTTYCGVSVLIQRADVQRAVVLYAEYL